MLSAAKEKEKRLVNRVGVKMQYLIELGSYLGHFFVFDD